MAILHVKTPNGTTQTLNLSNVVTSVVTGSSNGTISVNGSNVAVKGLASGAYAAAYTHPTTAGNKHIPTGGASGQILIYSASGTAKWADEYSYTHPTTAGNKHIPSGGASGNILGWSASGTAKWVASQQNISASSIAANGYTSFSNGLLIQWGKTSVGSDSGSWGLITFPIKFSEVYSFCGVHFNDSGTWHGVIFEFSALSTNQVGADSNYGKAWTCSWIAIGKK